MDVLKVVKERLFLLDDVILSPTTLEFYGWPPTCSPASGLNLFLRSSASLSPPKPYIHLKGHAEESLNYELGKG